MANGNAQQLYGSNISGNIGEEQGARIKDPLWFLARQWQSGEFEAENGGRVAYLTISAREDPLQTVKLGGAANRSNRDSPLDALIESEAANGDAPAWQAEALEYAFEAETTTQRLVGRDYVGRALDWYNFDVAGAKRATMPEPTSRQMTPTQIYFPGMPESALVAVRGRQTRISTSPSTPSRMSFRCCCRNSSTPISTTGTCFRSP